MTRAADRVAGRCRRRGATACWRDQRGVALVMALIILMTLTALMLAFLSVSLFEPQISANLNNTLRARYVAEAGIEWGFRTLVGTLDWSGLLTGTACSPAGLGVALPGGTNVPLPGLTAANGTFTVCVRNDSQAGDNLITGVPIEASATVDTNNILILSATGAVSPGRDQASRSIQVVVQRGFPQSIPAAISMPGLQTDTYIGNVRFDIDGRDYDRDGGRTLNAARFGLAVPPGVQQNLSPLTYEGVAEQGFDTSAKQSHIIGLDQTNPLNPPVTGLNTIAPDTSSTPLTPTRMSTFLKVVAASPSTKLFQVSSACPMVLTGTGGSDHLPTLTDGCGINQTLDIGTTSSPAVVYFKRNLTTDPSAGFTLLTLSGRMRGAGALIVEDGDLRHDAELRWDGVIAVAGQYIGVTFASRSETTVYGTFIAMETVGNEPNGRYELNYDGLLATFRYSQQDLDMVKALPGVHRLYGWREL